MKTERRTPLQKSIAGKVAALRRERLFTQIQLAAILGISQNRLSEIENGHGSLTAEQLLTILKTFNIPVEHFETSKKSIQSSLQNALVRLGAKHLGENQDTLPTRDMNEVADVVREVLASAESPRQIAALTPVLVNHVEIPILNKLLFHFSEARLIPRFAWLLDNIIEAIKTELSQNQERLPSAIKTKYERAHTLIDFFLKAKRLSKNESVDIIDGDIISPQTIDDIRRNSSEISERWRVISRLMPADFLQALRDAYELS